MFRKSRRQIGGRLAVSAALVSAAWLAWAEPTGQINYQGRLLDSSGRGVNGTAALAFRMYDAAGGGTLLWSETHGTVTVADGLYAVILGSVTPISSAIFARDEVYLELEINGETLAPRQRITAAAYALAARTVLGPDLTIDPTSGYVGIGTTAPTAKLDVNGTVRLTGLQMPTGAGAGYILVSDSAGTAQWQANPAVTNETDPVWRAVSNLYDTSAQVDAKVTSVSNSLQTAIDGKVAVSVYSPATNNLWTAVNSKLSLAGGVMTGPVTNEVGFYGNGGGLTNINASGVTLTNYVRRTGDSMSGALLVSNRVTVSGGELVLSPQTQTVTNDGVILVSQAAVIQVAGAGAAATNVGLAAGLAGQAVTLVGNDAANTVRLDPTSANLSLSEGVPFTLKTGDVIQLVYIGSTWREVGRSEK